MRVWAWGGGSTHAKLSRAGRKGAEARWGKEVDDDGFMHEKMSELGRRGTAARWGQEPRSSQRIGV